MGKHCGPIKESVWEFRPLQVINFPCAAYAVHWSASALQGGKVYKLGWSISAPGPLVVAATLIRTFRKHFISFFKNQTDFIGSIVVPRRFQNANHLVQGTDYM